MILTPPKNAIRIRRPSLVPNYRYHFVTGRRQSTTVCGIVLHTQFYQWEAARVQDIRPGDLCSKCWPFGYARPVQGKMF